jgi:hypothetical protein
MTTMANGHAGIAAPPEAVTLVPVRSGEREIGAYAVSPGGVVFVPAVDVSRIVAAAVGAATAMTVAVSIAAAVRRRPAIGTVTMGPGGWVSLKRTGMPPMRAAGRRPWWAHLLGARRLVIQR